ncbi:MAG: sphingomyelin phosphodiesterase [Planctomycetota bacterium]
MKKPPNLLLLVLMCLVCCPAEAAEPDIVSSASSVNNANSVNMRVLSYNVWMVPIQGKRSTERAKIIGSGLGCYDLVFLQEVFGDKSKDRILSNTSSGFSVRYRGEKDTLLDSGAITLSRNCITKCKFKKFGTCRGPQCYSGRGILYVQIRLPNGVLLDTFNIHLQAMEPDADVRCSQINDLKSMIECYNDGCNPVLIAGDFNIIGENPEYYCLLERLPGYRDVWTEVNAGCPGYTWDPVKNDWGDEDHHESKKSQRLDYIFIRDGSCASISVQCASVDFDNKKKTGRKRLLKSNCIFPSDHFGIGSYLTVTPTGFSGTDTIIQTAPSPSDMVPLPTAETSIIEGEATETAEVPLQLNGN